MKKTRKALGTITKGAATLLIIVLLISKLGWHDILVTVATAKIGWLFLALALFLISGLLGVFQWQILLQNRGIPLKFNRAFQLYFIGMFFNNFVLGGIVGDAMKVASLKAQNGKGMAGLAATFLDRFAGLWAMCGFAVMGSLVLLHHGTLANGKVGTAIIALFVTFLLFVGIMIFLIVKPLQHLFFSLADSIPLTRKARLREIVSEMLIEAHDLHILLRVALLSAVIQFLRIGVHIFAALSLSLLTPDNYQYFFIFVPIIAMLMTLPLPFGVREAAGGALFTLAGFPSDAAFVMGFLASLVGLAASLAGGIFFITNRTMHKEPV